MNARAYRSGFGMAAMRVGAMAVALLIVLLRGAACAGQAAGATQAAGIPQAAGAGQRVALDRVVAVVNGDLILESDVEAEQRFAAFQPFSEPGTSRDKLIERLVDRALILQQLKLQPEPPITDAQVDAQLALLRKSLPECAAYHCETDAGWEKFIAAHGVTLEELRDRWRMELGVLRFIDERFRMGIHIQQPEIDAYYQKTLVPAFEKQKATPPEEAKVADRIQEVLMQERVTSLMDDWLKTLRAQGTVQIVKPGEALP
jgi:peptidyl-prolyl cis-trans isomerase SurA